jgi:hypothetical protein
VDELVGASADGAEGHGRSPCGSFQEKYAPAFRDEALKVGDEWEARSSVCLAFNDCWC